MSFTAEGITKEDVIAHAKELPSQEVKGEVYFLLQDDEIVYVGQTISGLARIQTHIKEGKKVFNKYAVLDVPVHLLNDAEAYYIVKFSPKYNASLPPNNMFWAKSKIKKLVGDGHVLRRALIRLGITPIWDAYFTYEDVNRIMEFVNE